MDALFARAFVDGVAPDSGPIPFVAGTESMLIDGRSFAMDGADLARFEANPVVLWNHNHDAPPIGRAVNTRVEGGQLRTEIEFDQSDEFARTVEGKYRDGFLNAVSMFPLPKDFQMGRRLPTGRINDWELVEVSGVSVPRDPASLKLGRSLMGHVGRELLDLSRDLSHNDLNDRLRTLLADRFGGDDDWVWVRDVGDDWVAYEIDDATYRIGYSVDGDDNVTLDGEPEKVRIITTFEPVDDAPERSLSDIDIDRLAAVLRDGLATDLGFQRSAPATPTQDPTKALKALADALDRPKEGTT